MIGKTIATVVTLAASVNAHGYLKVPAARNWAKSIAEHQTYEPQSLPAGGPGSVFENGYEHGMCGDSKANPDQKWNMPGVTQATYLEGEAIDMSAVITAHHLGFFEAQLCDKQDISEECFYAHRLMRPGCTDVNDEECFRVWKPLLSTEANHNSLGGFTGTVDAVNRDSSNIFTTEFDYKMVLPQGVTCSDCVLRWHWFTTNSCEPTSDGKSGTSEEFWNCADVRVHDVLGQATPSAATGAQVTALRADVPRNMYSEALRSQNMWRFCPAQAYPTDPALFNTATCPMCDMKTMEAGNTNGSSNNNSGSNYGGSDDNAVISSDYRCGLDWNEASNNCNAVCNTNDDCPTGQACYSGLSAAPCGTTATTTSVAAAPTTATVATTTFVIAVDTTTSSVATPTASACVTTVINTSTVTHTATTVVQSTATVTITSAAATTSAVANTSAAATTSTTPVAPVSEECGDCQGCKRTFATGSACYSWDVATCNNAIAGNTATDFYTMC